MLLTLCIVLPLARTPRPRRFNATAAILRTMHSLTDTRRLPMAKWLRLRPRDESLLVQVGAHAPILTANLYAADLAAA